MSRWIFVAFVPLLIACEGTSTSQIEKRDDRTTVFSGVAMTMRYRIIIGDDIYGPEIAKVQWIIQKAFQETDAIFNKWNPASEVSRLNQQKDEFPIPISPQLERLFQETTQIVSLSQGRFDPTIEPLQRLWKQKLQKEEIPSDKELDDIASAIGWGKIHVSNGMFKKDHELVKMDFGGIAKGLCIDMLVEHLNEEGFHHVFVEWGGEIRATGLHPEGRPWTIYISRLGDNDPSHAIATIFLDSQAVATSGDYLQNWTVLGNTYFHIFDPRTLRPLQATHASIASVSVVAPTCALADGLATAAMMFSSINEAKTWAEQIKEQSPEISFWFVSRKAEKK